ncbi:MAG: GDP-mannose 4,6-dehydratase [Bryobacteraceae bacterium]|jgi:GDPmannose 4,6-dehydratase
MKKALITGITGQDGSFLAEFLLAKGYEVHGLTRRASTFNTERLDPIYADPHESGASLFLHYGDVTDGTGLRRTIEKVRPAEIYNLAAQSHVRVSFDQPEYTADVVATGTLRLLEAVRDYMSVGGEQVRIYQAGSSEMYGAAAPPQSERTPFYPRSPYAVGKVAGHWYAVNYREAYAMFISNGILFNHESERRGETFVTRKITRALGRIRMGLQKKLFLGNLEARRDWGYAGDYVEAMWLMLQQPAPDDFVIATGEAHSVREFLDTAAECVDLDWHRFVETDSRYLRPTEVDYLLGDASKARQQLGWKPRMDFRELVRRMVEHDLDQARQESLLMAAGHKSVMRGALHT